jgi:hypothetical protein
MAVVSNPAVNAAAATKPASRPAKRFVMAISYPQMRTHRLLQLTICAVAAQESLAVPKDRFFTAIADAITVVEVVARGERR